MENPMNRNDRHRIQSWLYIGMAIALFICLFPMPYGYYQLVRFLAMAVFAYLAFIEYKENSFDRMILFIVLAILFQPFAKLSFGRVLWSVVDLLVAAYLLYLFFKSRK